MSKWTFWKNGTLVRDEDKCTHCGKCAVRCPHLVLLEKDGAWKIRGLCMRCGHCVNECPTGALSIIKDGDPNRR